MNAHCGRNGRDLRCLWKKKGEGDHAGVGKSRGIVGSTQNTGFMLVLLLINYCIIHLTLHLLLLSPVFGSRDLRR